MTAKADIETLQRQVAALTGAVGALARITVAAQLNRRATPDDVRALAPMAGLEREYVRQAAADETYRVRQASHQTGASYDDDPGHDPRVVQAILNPRNSNDDINRLRAQVTREYAERRQERAAPPPPIPEADLAAALRSPSAVVRQQARREAEDRGMARTMAAVGAEDSTSFQRSAPATPQFPGTWEKYADHRRAAGAEDVSGLFGDEPDPGPPEPPPEGGHYADPKPADLKPEEAR